MKWHRNLNKTLFCIMFLLGFFPRNFSIADDMAISQRWNQLVEYYIENAFANGNLTLRKFDLVGTIPIAIECPNLTQTACATGGKILSMSIDQSPNLQFKLSEQPAVTFVFGVNSQIKSFSEQALKDYSGGISDVSDPECEVYYKYSGSRIQQGTIFASINQLPAKLSACLIVQVGRLLGPGFSATDKFSLRWSAALRLQTEEQMGQTKNITGILEYIHMCPELTPGLTEVEVRKILLSPKSCISKLEGVQ